MNPGRTREEVPVGHPGGEEAVTLGLQPYFSSSTIPPNALPEAPGSGSALGQRPLSYRRRHRTRAISLDETSLPLAWEGGGAVVPGDAGGGFRGDRSLAASKEPSWASPGLL